MRKSPEGRMTFGAFGITHHCTTPLLITYFNCLQHKDPDYSCAYVTLITSQPGLFGYGLTFTLGRGTEIGETSHRKKAIKSHQKAILVFIEAAFSRFPMILNHSV